jgi:hypothetical protein
MTALLLDICEVLNVILDAEASLEWGGKETVSKLPHSNAKQLSY